jgi:FtsZ-interacting cell division protein ZipA
MLSNTEIYLIGLGFFLAILGAFLYFRKVSNSNKMLLEAKQANLKDLTYKSEAFAKQDLVILYLFSIDGKFFDMSQLNDFLINYGFEKNDDFFSVYDNDVEKFRVANALKPGTLIEDTQTQALLLVTDMAAQKNATDSVEDLLRFASKFCEKIYANICDSDRQPLSAESIKDLKMRASRYLLNDEESS